MNTSIAPADSESISQLSTSQQWRLDTAQALLDAGYDRHAREFIACGRSYSVVTCSTDVSHSPRALPQTCKKRWCPDCERRESARKLARYVSPINDLQWAAPKGYRLKHLTLTTPFSLYDLDAPERLEIIFKQFRNFLDRLFLVILGEAGKLTRSERRRGRVELKKHKIGALVGAEYGEEGKKLHLHILILCPYLDGELVKKCWFEATQKTSYISKIRVVDPTETENAIAEVVKYVTKFTEFDPRDVPYLVRVMEGQRRFRSYGEFYGIVGREKRDTSRCEICDSLQSIIDFRTYLEKCFDLNVPVCSEVVASIEASNALPTLDLKPVNKSGDLRSGDTRRPILSGFGSNIEATHLLPSSGTAAATAYPEGFFVQKKAQNPRRRRKHRTH